MYEIKLNGTKFFQVKPAFYAQEMAQKVSADPALWEKLFSTKELAQKVRESCGGDYAKVWCERCAMCWGEITAKTNEKCYRSEDGLTWICKDCFADLCNMPQNEVEE